MTTIKDTDARPLFCVNASEREALRGLRWIAHEVYLFGLRPFMDYSSGIVGGPARRVSYQSIAEELYVEPGPGIRDSGKPSERQIRRAIESLQRAGLLSVNRCKKIRKTGKTDYQPYLVFECLLAKRDRSARKQLDSHNAVQASSIGSIYHEGNAMKNKGLNDKKSSQAEQLASAENAEVVTPPAFKSFTTTSLTSRDEEAVAEQSAKAKAQADAPDMKRFSMFYTWEPDEGHVGFLASSLGVNPDALTDEVLKSFCFYWAINHPEKQQTQQQWELQLINHLKHRAIEAKEREEQRKAREAEREQAKAAADAKAQAKSALKSTPKAKAEQAGNVVSLRTVPVAAEANNTSKADTAKALQQLEQLEATLSDEQARIAFVWDELKGLYGWKFMRSFGDNPTGAWGRALRSIDDRQLDAGLDNLIEASPAWPPSALEFRQLCLQIPGVPSLKQAWFDALSGHYRHPAVEQAAKKTGLEGLRYAASGELEPNRLRDLRDRFHAHYQNAVNGLSHSKKPQSCSASAEAPLPELETIRADIEALIEQRLAFDPERAAQVREHAQRLQDNYSAFQTQHDDFEAERMLVGLRGLRANLKDLRPSGQAVGCAA